MNEIPELKITRKQIGLRLLYTLLFMVAFEILKLVIQVTVLFQYIYLLVAREYSAPLRSFSNKAAVYAYKLIRFLTLNDNSKPFPFAEFPVELDPPADHVEF
jgi:hypothetical protein